MKKRCLLAFSLVLTLLTFGCQRSDDRNVQSKQTAQPQQHEIVSPDAPEEQKGTEEATLYFRYRSEPCLAQETRTVQRIPGTSYEAALLNELLAGPSAQAPTHAELFPNGVQVLSVTGQGRNAYVTLNDRILGSYADENRQTRDEMSLRRHLCLASMAAVLAVNCDYDAVVILVQDRSTRAVSRLTDAYYGEKTGQPLPPLTLEDAAILTPDTTAQLLLSLWQKRDWSRMYLYVSDGMNATDTLTQQDFVTLMDRLPGLVSCECAHGEIIAAGTRALLPVKCSLLFADGSAAVESTWLLRLTKRSGLWTVSVKDLTAWLEEII